MNREIRTLNIDKDLNIEAYNFRGIMQKFPNHFHDCYVIGFIEEGKRRLTCKNKEYIINPGDIIIFNPFDNHQCEQIDNKVLNYCSININVDTMKKIVYEITGRGFLPKFNEVVLYKNDLAIPIKELHDLIINPEKDFKKEELLLFLIERLIKDYTDSSEGILCENSSKEFKEVCDYLEENYSGSISLDDLSKLAGLSKYYFLRCFTKKKGITPYSYLEAIRIDKAKKLLEKGVIPIDTSVQTGFSDQSHFCKFFKRFIGLTPMQYYKIHKESKKEV